MLLEATAVLSPAARPSATRSATPGRRGWASQRTMLRARTSCRSVSWSNCSPVSWAGERTDRRPPKVPRACCQCSIPRSWPRARKVSRHSSKIGLSVSRMRPSKSRMRAAILTTGAGSRLGCSRRGRARYFARAARPWCSSSSPTTMASQQQEGERRHPLQAAEEAVEGPELAAVRLGHGVSLLRHLLDELLPCHAPPGALVVVEVPSRGCPRNAGYREARGAARAAPRRSPGAAFSGRRVPMASMNMTTTSPA